MRVENHAARLLRAAAWQRDFLLKSCRLRIAAAGHGYPAAPAGATMRAQGEAMRKFVIEREIPGIGAADSGKMRDIARKSNGILEGLGGGIHWVESYVAGDRLYCVYLAQDEAIIRKHAEKGGFPANRITEVKRMIDPSTALA
jgi:Protein of unknown function (DUF4242)